MNLTEADPTKTRRHAACDRADPVIVRWKDVDRRPLAGAGNYLFRVPLGTGPLGAGIGVLKIYEGSRSRLLYWKKTFGNLVLTGRTSHMPRTRCRTEVDCVRLWQSHGFRCFGLHPEVQVEGLHRDVYMVYEWVPGLHFRDYFKNRSIPLEARMETWRRWIPEWHRRHKLCVETSDPRLIQENGDVKHVMLHEGDFVYFDFEMVFRSRDTRPLVGREIQAYMRSVGRFFGDALYDRMLAELVEHYPDKALLHSAYEAAFEDRRWWMRGLRALDRWVKPANRKRYSKYNVAQDIHDRLFETSMTVEPR